MDTKLRNINRRKATKITAFVLAVVLFFVSGYFASLFYRELFIYDSVNSDSFTQAPVFRNMLNDYEFSLLISGEEESATTIEEFKKTSLGRQTEESRKEALERVEESFTVLDASGIKVFITEDNRYRYRLDYANSTLYFSYNGEIISAEQFNDYEYVYEYDYTEHYVDGEELTTFITPAEYDMYYGGNVTKIGDALRYLNSLSEYSCYGEIDKASALKLVNEQYDNTLEIDFQSRGMWTRLAQNTDSVKYAVFFTSTGNVITNCGVTRADTREQILDKIGGEFVEGYENGEYVLIKGEPVKSEEGIGAAYDLHNEFINYTSYDGYSSAIIKRASGEGVAKMYISYGYTGTDLFSLLHDMYNKFHIGFSLKTMGIISVVCFLLACAIGIYLISFAGKKEDGTVAVCFADRIPFIISLALGIGVMVLIGLVIFGAVACEFDPSIIAVVPMSLLSLVAMPLTQWSALLFALFFIIPTLLLMSVARNVRNKTFWKHTLVYWLLKPVRWLWGKLKICFARLRKMLTVDYTSDGRKFRKYAIIAVCVVTAIGLLLAFFSAIFTYGGGVLFFVLFFLFCIPVVLYCLIHIFSLDKIMNAVSQTKQGRLDSKIDTHYMPGFMRNFAEDIGTMQDGLQNAVESAVKDQRMKAELITNVSHDLKTPLTSIVSYVDLLKRCEVENEDAKKYIDILDEKSQRMKKLIEDLVEASKASSGAIELHPVKINLCEFAAQAVGEHSDELKKCGIEIVLRSAQNPVFVTADAQKTSRIIENLFSNIRKYAMENTRVYVEVAGGNQYGSIVLKNISKYPLDVQPDELVQRFVRGDSSRTGEGSGLGLSIANNLCELQKGKFNVHVDGDLFKVTVALPITQ